VTNRLARLISQLPEEQIEGKSDQKLTQVVARSLKELERSCVAKFWL